MPVKTLPWGATVAKFGGCLVCKEVDNNSCVRLVVWFPKVCHESRYGACPLLYADYPLRNVLLLLLHVVEAAEPGPAYTVPDVLGRVTCAQHMC